MDLVRHEGGRCGKARIEADLDEVAHMRELEGPQRLEEERAQHGRQDDRENPRRQAEHERDDENAGEEYRERVAEAPGLERKLGDEPSEDDEDGARKLDRERPARRFSDRSDHRGNSFAGI